MGTLTLISPFFWRFLKSISQMNSEHNFGFLFLFLLSLPFSLSIEGFLTLYFLFLANKVPSIMTPLARRAGKETFNIASISKSVKPWLHDYQKFAHMRSRSLSLVRVCLSFLQTKMHFSWLVCWNFCKLNACTLVHAWIRVYVLGLPKLLSS